MSATDALAELFPAFAGFIAQELVVPAGITNPGEQLMMRAALFLATVYAVRTVTTPGASTSRYPQRQMAYNEFTNDAQWNVDLYIDRNARRLTGRYFLEQNIG